MPIVGEPGFGAFELRGGKEAAFLVQLLKLKREADGRILAGFDFHLFTAFDRDERPVGSIIGEDKELVVVAQLQGLTADVHDGSKKIRGVCHLESLLRRFGASRPFGAAADDGSFSEGQVGHACD